MRGHLVYTVRGYKANIVRGKQVTSNRYLPKWSQSFPFCYLIFSPDRRKVGHRNIPEALLI